jgi:hypothetical protein
VRNESRRGDAFRSARSNDPRRLSLLLADQATLAHRLRAALSSAGRSSAKAGKPSERTRP